VNYGGLFTRCAINSACCYRFSLEHQGITVSSANLWCHLKMLWKLKYNVPQACLNYWVPPQPLWKRPMSYTYIAMWPQLETWVLLVQKIRSSGRSQNWHLLWSIWYFEEFPDEKFSDQCNVMLRGVLGCVALNAQCTEACSSDVAVKISSIKFAGWPSNLLVALPRHLIWHITSNLLDKLFKYEM
jgi:hypothetical protein